MTGAEVSGRSSGVASSPRSNSGSTSSISDITWSFYVESGRGKLLDTIITHACCIVGSGFVAVPFATRMLGLPATICALLVLAACSFQTYTVLVLMAEDRGLTSFEAVGAAAFGRLGFFTIFVLELLIGASVAIVNTKVAARLLSAAFAIELIKKYHYVIVLVAAAPSLLIGMIRHPSSFVIFNTIGLVMATVSIFLVVCVVTFRSHPKLPPIMCILKPHNSWDAIHALGLLSFCFLAQHKALFAYRSMRFRSEEGRWRTVAWRSIHIAFAIYLFGACVGYFCMENSDDDGGGDDDDNDDARRKIRGFCAATSMTRAVAQALMGAFLALLVPMDVHAVRVHLARFLGNHSSHVHAITTKSSVWYPTVDLECGGCDEESLENSLEHRGSDTNGTISGRDSMNQLSENQTLEPPLLPPAERGNGDLLGAGLLRSPTSFHGSYRTARSFVDDLDTEPVAYRHSDAGQYHPPSYHSVPRDNEEILSMSKTSEGPTKDLSSVKPKISEECERVGVSGNDECRQIDSRSRRTQQRRRMDQRHWCDEGQEADMAGRVEIQRQSSAPYFFCGIIDASFALHVTLTAGVWVTVVIGAIFLKFRHALLLMSYLGGFGGCLLAFIIPSACYFRLAPLSSDFSAVTHMKLFGRPIVPNEACMLGIFVIGVVIFALHSFVATSCLLARYHGHNSDGDCQMSSSAYTEVATSGFDAG